MSMDSADVIAVARWKLYADYDSAGELCCRACGTALNLDKGDITIDDVFLAVTSHIAVHHNSSAPPL